MQSKRKNINYSDFVWNGNTVCYQSRPVYIDAVYDITMDDYASNEDIRRCPSLCIASIVHNNFANENVLITELMPLRHLNELHWDELIQLRRETVFGRFFYSAYDNSFGVDKRELAEAADAYLYAIENRMELLEGSSDTPENFAYYCQNLI